MAPGSPPQDAEATSFFTVSETVDERLEVHQQDRDMISEYRGNKSLCPLGDLPARGDLPHTMHFVGRFPGNTTLEMVTYNTSGTSRWQDATVIIKRSTTLLTADCQGKKIHLRFSSIHLFTLAQWVNGIHPRGECPIAGGMLWWHELNHLRLRLSERAYLELQKVLDAINFQEPPPVWYVQPIPAEQLWKQIFTRVRTLPKTRADHTCMICRSRFKKSKHNPVKLPCGHVVGEDCIKPWLTSGANSGCPLCFRPCFPLGLMETASWKPDLGVRRELLFQQELDTPFDDNMPGSEELADFSPVFRLTELWNATKQSGQGSVSQPERYNPAGWMEMFLVVGQIHQALKYIETESGMSFSPKGFEDWLSFEVNDGFEQLAKDFSRPRVYPPTVEAFIKRFVHRYVNLLWKPDFEVPQHEYEEQAHDYKHLEEHFSTLL